MAQTCNLTGIVLKSSPSGEYDRRIVLLTKERGKVTCFARGARRAKSSLQAATNLFCFGTYEAYEGRDSYTVVKADIQNYFTELSKDLDKTFYGCYFLELADYFTREGVDCVEQLKLLYQSLRALGSKTLSEKLVRCIYEWKTLAIYGVYPNVFGCAQCGKDENLHYISFQYKGALCKTCGRNYSDYSLAEGTLYTLQYIYNSSIQKLYTFTVTDGIYEDLKFLVRRYLSQYIDREMKTVVFLPDE